MSKPMVAQSGSSQPGIQAKPGGPGIQAKPGEPMIVDPEAGS